MSEVHMGGWSDEECLLGYDKYVSNTRSNDYDDLPRISNDKDVYHEHPRMMGPQKYLGKRCYHCNYFPGCIYVEKTPEQCCLDYHNSQKNQRRFLMGQTLK